MKFHALAVTALLSMSALASGGGLSISTDSGVSFTNKTTSNGLGSNLVKGVYDDSNSNSNSNIYAAISGGLSISR